MAETESRDVVVIGAGPAGLSAALVLGRARRSVTVVDAGRPRNGCSAAVHGFLTRDGAAPADFLAVARREVSGYGVEIVADEASAVVVEDADAPSLRVELAGGRHLRARRVVVASGIVDELPDVVGLAERWGRDVLHCPYCHGHEVRDRPLVVLAGDTEGAVHQALLLRQWSEDVTVVTHAAGPVDDDVLLAARGVQVVSGRAREVVTGDDGVTAVLLDDGTRVACGAVFVAPRFRLNSAALEGLGARTVDSDMGTALDADDEGRTSVPGVWAAGNVVDLSCQVLGAAELGSRAAIGINGELALADARAAAQGLESAQHAGPGGEKTRDTVQ
ncbi:Thioredoxin reductase [Georgenia satyanarayanai]|uniref:Thioredoxin reductase n=1 Tax=Georgenia satyanarayanai TaxID=860221 RepID=A0A2Y9AYA2_9MICO|nr:NAD(P)/FAD-dependent oxidoreductase [Georgenia satyanarayanai]PYF96253.1 thioredoxin reductase [Georgenia satyanarayanai]SSA47089.1 Thioredoxin reductase [Georgenia satyanarayanai]